MMDIVEQRGLDCICHRDFSGVEEITAFKNVVELLRTLLANRFTGFTLPIRPAPYPGTQLRGGVRTMLKSSEMAPLLATAHAP